MSPKQNLQRIEFDDYKTHLLMRYHSATQRYHSATIKIQFAES